MEDDISSTENDEPPGSGWIQNYPSEVLSNVISTPENPLLQIPQQNSTVAEPCSNHAGKAKLRTKTDTLRHGYSSKPAAFVSGERSLRFREEFFPEVSDHQWNDWRWQLANRIKDLQGLERIIRLSENELFAIVGHCGSLPVGITPYYAGLLDRENPLQPLRRTVVRTTDESRILPEEDADPLNEDGDSPVRGLVHRYPDRVLFLTTGFCSVYCRYCTRSRMVGNHGGEHGFDMKQWEAALDYIETHPEIRDVILSGGDPLTLPDSRIDWLLRRLRAIEH
ncbi:MAG: lysine 2,3-aminomutase, partial [Acidobacteriota bacterium]